MRNQFYPLFYSLIAGVLVSCNGNKKVAVSQDDTSSNFITLPCSKSLKASEIDSIQFPIDKMAISPSLTEKHSKVGVDMAKNKFHLNGPSKMVVLNSMGVVLEKLKIMTVVT